MRWKLFAVLTGLLLTGCVTVPPLAYNGAGVSEIVQRVKCELALSMPDREGPYPTGKFQWMKYWTTKVDLTLETTDASTLTPNSSFIDPSIFTFGIGGNLDTTAYRSDKLSFTVSMEELAASKKSSECEVPQRSGLLGGLGLQEWVSSALTPVGKLLEIGYHQPPTGKQVSLPGPGRDKPPAARERALAGESELVRQVRIAVADYDLAKEMIFGAPAIGKEKERKGALEFLRAGENLVEQGRDKSDEAYAHARCPVKVDKKCHSTHNGKLPQGPDRANWIQVTFDSAGEALQLIDSAKENIESARILAWRAKTHLLGAKRVLAAIEDASLATEKKKLEERLNAAAVPGEKKRIEDQISVLDRGEKAKGDVASFFTKDGLLDEIAGRAKEAVEQADIAKGAATDSWNLLPRDPPLDSIAHSVKFTVDSSLNGTPNWTLARFRGPGLSSPFLKARRQRVHTLDLVLGAPATPGGKDLSEEQRRQLLNLKLDSLRLFVVPINIP